MPIHFEEIFTALKSEIAKFAKETFTENANDARNDGQKLLELLKNQLKRYTQQLANGELTSAEFKDLILGQKDELEMMALKRAGIALIEADKFKNSILNLIVNTITGLI